MNNKNIVVLGAALALILQLVWPVVAGAEMVPDNKVGISMFGFVLSGDYSEVSGQPTGPGELKNGNVDAYPEGTCVPVEIEVKNNSSQAGDIIVSPVYDYWDGNSVIGIDNLEKITTSLLGNPRDSVDNLNDFVYPETPLTTTDTFNSSGGTITAVVTGPYAGDDAGVSPITPTDAFRHYNIILNNVPADETIYVIFCGRLGVDASLYNGSKMSIRTVQGGKENVPISANQLLTLPSITIIKEVQGGTATPDQWSFNVAPAINGQSDYLIPAGLDRIVIDNVSPDGDYTIIENGPADYIFASGSGTNCVFNGSTAVASVAAGKPAQDAVCTFVNQYNPPTTGTLTVTKDVINNNGGDKQISDFPLFVDQTSITSGETITLTAGSYVVSEINQAGYQDPPAFGGACDESGNVTISVGEDVICTLTNDDIAPTLTVNKVLEPITDTGLFNLIIDLLDGYGDVFDVGNGGTTGAVSLNAGLHQVSETEGTNTKLADYITTINCGGQNVMDTSLDISLALGENKTCTITNILKQGGIVVMKETLPDQNPTLFNFTTSYGQPFSLSDGQMNNSGVLDPGLYSVSEDSLAGWVLQSASCISDKNQSVIDPSAINLSPDETVVCTFTNVKLSQISGSKFNDLDGEGDWDNGEPTLPDGWTITLSGPINATTTTDADGKYSFTGLTPGTYTVCEQQKAGWNQTYPAQGACHTVELTNIDVSEINFGNYQVPEPVCNGSISGKKYNSHTSLGLPNWSIQLRDSQMNFLKSALTDSDGFYLFDNLCSQTYIVNEVLQQGWVQVLPQDANYYQPDLGYYYLRSLGQGEKLTGIDFANDPEYSISGMKFNDSDKDGSKDEGEAGLAGWVIGLFDPTNLIATTTTNGDGLYSFTYLLAGNYKVCETSQTNWTQTYPTDNQGCHLVTVGPTATEKNFGNYYQAPQPPEEPSTPSAPSGGGGGGGGGTTLYKVTVDKTSVEQFTNPGAIINFTITIGNTGSGIIYNLTVTDTLPSGFVYVETGLSTRQWQIAELKVGAIEKITYQAKTASDIALGAYTNTAKAEASVLGTVSDDASIEVRSPQVLGTETTTPSTSAGTQEGSVLGMSTLPATGAGLSDSIIWFLGLTTLILGIFGLKKTLIA